MGVSDERFVRRAQKKVGSKTQVVCVWTAHAQLIGARTAHAL